MNDDLLDETIKNICDDPVSPQLVDRCRAQAKAIAEQPLLSRPTVEANGMSWGWQIAIGASLLLAINVATSIARQPDPNRTIVARATFSGMKPQVLFSDLRLEPASRYQTVAKEN